LHVLGTPPAFILSQDQTRHPIDYLSDLLTTEKVQMHGWLRSGRRYHFKNGRSRGFARRIVRNWHVVTTSVLPVSCSAFHSSVVKVPCHLSLVATVVSIAYFLRSVKSFSRPEKKVICCSSGCSPLPCRRANKPWRLKGFREQTDRRRATLPWHQRLRCQTGASR
jgi:hypothetical protein